MLFFFIISSAKSKNNLRCYVAFQGKTIKQKIVKASSPFPEQALVFTCLQQKSFENTVGKGEIARNEQFLLFPQRFQAFLRTFCHYHKI